MQFQFMGIGSHKMKMRMTRLCLFNNGRRKIDANATGWVKGSEQIAGTTANFHHALSGRNGESKHFPQTFMVIGVKPSPLVECFGNFIPMCDPHIFVMNGTGISVMVYFCVHC